MLKAGTTEIQKRASRTSQYATASEFCQIFINNMDSLYTLALALTADKAKAEECFLSALEECRKSATVFRQWAQSWSRLAVIESAIRLIRPSANDVPNDVPDEVPNGGEVEKNIHPAAVSVSKLRAFDRFTFVMSVLDHYSVRDCAILLKCRPQEIRRARQRAVEFIAKAGSYLAAPAEAIVGARLTA